MLRVELQNTSYSTVYHLAGNKERFYFPGLDIGPMSKIHWVDGDIEKRCVIKVDGHMAWSGIGMQSYYAPTYYLLDKRARVCDITYSRKHATHAKALMLAFLSGLDLKPQRIDD